MEKVKELLYKLRDGLRIYQIARDSSVERRLLQFDSTTRVKVYVLTWLEDDFLNNLFLRLAEAYYQSAKPDSYIILRYKFFKSSLYTYDKPVFKPAKPSIEVSETIRARLSGKLSIGDLEGLAYNSLASYEGGVQSDEFRPKFYESVNQTLESIIDAGLKVSPNDKVLGWFECGKFCNMNQDERCAYIFYKLLEDLDNKADYKQLVNKSGYVVKANILLGEEQKIEIEKEFKSYTNKDQLQEYVDFLNSWQVDYLYTGLIEKEFPTTSVSDFNPTDDKYSCIGLCVSYSNHSPPAAVKLIADALTSVYTSPVKIVYGKNFIFEDEEVTTLDRGLAFIDVPGIGVVSKTIALKIGIKSLLVTGIAKTLNTTEILNDLIKKSNVLPSISTIVKNALNTLPDARKVFVFKGLTDKIIKVEDIPDFVKAIKNVASDKWDDILVAWNLAKGLSFKTIDEFWDKIPAQFRQSVKDAFVKGTTLLKYAEKDLILYRHISRDGKVISYWMTDKIFSPQDARKLLALPESNSANWIAEIWIKKGTPYVEGTVASQVGNKWFGPYAVGKGKQFYFLDESINNSEIINLKSIYLNPLE